MWTNMAGIMAATVLVQNSHSKSDTSYIFLKKLVSAPESEEHLCH